MQLWTAAVNHQRSARSKIIVLLELIPGLVERAEDRPTNHALLRRSSLRNLLVSVCETVRSHSFRLTLSGWTFAMAFI